MKTIQTTDINNGQAREIEQLKQQVSQMSLKMQELEDSLESGLRSVNVKETRQTYICNADSVLDDDYPMLVYFDIPSDMSKLVSVKVYFKILNYRYPASTGVSEEENHPDIYFSISEDAGASYWNEQGPYSSSQSAVDITSYLSGTGEKVLKFTTDERIRLSVEVQLKMDIKAR